MDGVHVIKDSLELRGPSEIGLAACKCLEMYNVYMCVCICMQIHTYIHTYMHAYIHAYTDPF